MKKFRRLFYVLSLALLTGCASTGPVYDSRTVTGPSAVIRAGGRWSFGAAHGFGSEASCTVAEIDGLPTSREAEDKRITAGKHTLGIRAMNARGMAVGYLDLDAKPGRVYTVRAREHGIGYIVTQLDITEEDREIELRTIKLLKSGDNSRQSVPIFIPVRPS